MAQAQPSRPAPRAAVIESRGEPASGTWACGRGPTGVKLVELRTKRAANQLLIRAIRGNAAFHVWSATRDSSPDKAILDVDVRACNARNRLIGPAAISQERVRIRETVTILPYRRDEGPSAISRDGRLGKTAGIRSFSGFG